jgi:hypothetical protein
MLMDRKAGDPDSRSGEFYWERLIWRASLAAAWLPESGDGNLTVQRFCTDACTEKEEMLMHLLVKKKLLLFAFSISRICPTPSRR